MHTDGSGQGISAALTQKDEDGRTQVIMYATRSLEDTELSYSAYELEFLAGRFSSGLFHDYIANSKVTWITDHSALVSVKLQSEDAHSAGWPI